MDVVRLCKIDVTDPNNGYIDQWIYVNIWQMLNWISWPMNSWSKVITYPGEILMLNAKDKY